MPPAGEEPLRAACADNIDDQQGEQLQNAAVEVHLGVVLEDERPLPPAVDGVLPAREIRLHNAHFAGREGAARPSVDRRQLLFCLGELAYLPFEQVVLLFQQGNPLFHQFELGNQG